MCSPEEAVAAAETLTGEETVDPFAGLQIFTPALDGGAHVAVLDFDSTVMAIALNGYGDPGAWL